MMHKLVPRAIGVLISVSALASCGGGDEPAPAATFNCAAIRAFKLGAHVKISQADPIKAGTVKAGAGGDFLPGHCLVQGTINARTGKAFSTDPVTRAVSVVDAPYAIGFELRLPKDWNGRFFFQGGSGLDGALAQALGVFNPQQGPADNALSRGFAVASTDGGHLGASGFDGNFGADPQARIDYAYNAVDQTTLASRNVLVRYYGRPADRSYFVGCSNGGRQGMMASQRFPAHFDGIVAGAPGFNYMPMVSNSLADVVTLAAAVPAGATTPFGPDLGQAFSASDRALIGKAVLAKCDVKGRDALADGIVADVQACDFHPQTDVAECGGANDGTCLSGTQKTALASLMRGGQTSQGAALYSDYFYDTGVGSPGWSVWKLDGIPVPLSPTLTVSLGLNQLAGMEGPGKVFMTPPDPTFNPFLFHPDLDPARMAAFGQLANATSTDLSAFKARGGKLILYNGNSDPLVSSKDLIRYHQALGEANGGSAADFARLFLVPGMSHCGGGDATDGFDPLSAIQKWVEHGTAPKAMTAMAGPASPWPERTRPLCAFPTVAVYKGQGDIEKASSFSCR